MLRTVMKTLYIITVLMLWTVGAGTIFTIEENSSVETLISRESLESKKNLQNSELQILRNLINKKVANYEDLINIIIIHKQKFDELMTFKQKEKYCLENNYIKEIYQRNSLINRGMVGYSIIKIYNLESSFMFWLTGMSRYALRDLQVLRIVGLQYSTNDSLSGTQALGMFDAAENEINNKKSWGKAILINQQIEK